MQPLDGRLTTLDDATLSSLDIVLRTSLAGALSAKGIAAVPTTPAEGRACDAACALSRGRELGVAQIVTGTVAELDGRWHVFLHLTDVTSGAEVRRLGLEAVTPQALRMALGEQAIGLVDPSAVKPPAPPAPPPPPPPAPIAPPAPAPAPIVNRRVVAPAPPSVTVTPAKPTTKISSRVQPIAGDPFLGPPGGFIPCAASWFVPGLGQVLNDQPAKGLGFFLTETLSMVVGTGALIGGITTNRSNAAGIGIGLTLLVFGTIVHFVGILDAALAGELIFPPEPAGAGSDAPLRLVRTCGDGGPCNGWLAPATR
jgi:hypothetical protein